MKILIKNLQRRVKVNRKRVTRLLNQLGRVLDIDRVELSIVFVNDNRMKELNRTYRSLDRTTDILSFPLYNSMKDIRQGLKTLPGGTLLGDIVINLHRTVEQAREHGNTFYEELTFLLIHGLLHLIGYDHEVNAYQARKMRKKELELIDALKKMG
ncbi:MAG: rRNA maturation RNase YbeY [Nitrospirae bacterium]|nr:rRNA maturation RNase YbeY [Nitrospirota bacterium]